MHTYIVSSYRVVKPWVWTPEGKSKPKSINVSLIITIIKVKLWPPWLLPQITVTGMPVMVWSKLVTTTLASSWRQMHVQNLTPTWPPSWTNWICPILNTNSNSWRIKSVSTYVLVSPLATQHFLVLIVWVANMIQMENPLTR